ncbi:MAG: anti-sigma factor [Pseudomonadota bacterium]
MTETRPLNERIDEYVIGLADPAEAAALERLAAEDPALATAIEAARARFRELDETAEALALPEDLWDRVAGALAMPDTEPAPAPDAPPEPARVVPFDRTAATRPWKWAGGLGLAASLVLAAMLVWTLMSRPEPTVIAVLLNDAGEPVAVVEGAADNTTLVTLLEDPAVPGDRVMQLWTKPEEDGPPISLGVLESARAATFRVQGLPVPSAEQLYEITFEAPGGSPTGLPTGPILGKGLAQEPL